MSRTKRFSPNVIARIVKEASSRAASAREESRFNQDVLDALHDLTRFPRAELERIAGEVTASGWRDFFSVRQQLLLAGTFIAAVSIPISALWVLLW